MFWKKEARNSLSKHGRLQERKWKSRARKWKSRSREIGKELTAGQRRRGAGAAGGRRLLVELVAGRCGSSPPAATEVRRFFLRWRRVRHLSRGHEAGCSHGVAVAGDRWRCSRPGAALRRRRGTGGLVAGGRVQPFVAVAGAPRRRRGRRLVAGGRRIWAPRGGVGGRGGCVRRTARRHGSRSRVGWAVSTGPRRLQS